ncbi:MAG: signal peptidase II [Planctomycetota bacterium]|nr:signal peptidase II [Planctomycetota bacterium]MDA0920603.1 signal peptidase II [Planctomycetota bacterium]MDA1159314.1 signal peptidase II [Planctomycetota bacterium]
MKSVPRNRYVCFILLALVGLAIDLGSKSSVFAELSYPGGRSDWSQGFFGDWGKFQLLTSINEGALWGMGQGYTWLFALLSIFAVAGVSVWLFVYGAAKSLWLTVALGLIMAGTLGNLYDRLGLHGCVRLDGSPIYGVRDFLAFTFGTYHYPIFNGADCFLVTGAIMLAIQSFRVEHTGDPVSEAPVSTGPTAPPGKSSLQSNG